MKKLLIALCLNLIVGSGIFAQTADEYKKNEFFAGFSTQALDRGRYTNINGFEGSYVRNVSRYLGIKGDVSAAYRNEKFNFPTLIFVGNGTINTGPTGTGTGTTTTTTGSTTTTAVRTEIKESQYNFLGGVQIRDNKSKARLRPFGHALAGVGHYRNTYEGSNRLFSNFNDTFQQTGFAAAIGGGLDVRINDHFDIRAIQADYNPIRFSGYWSNNFRFGFGIVIK